MALFHLKKWLFKSYLAIPLNKPLFSLVKSFGLPPYRIRKYLRFKGPFKLMIEEQIPLTIMNYGNTIENELFWRGMKGWEPKAVTLWKNLCKTSAVIFDVGANTGLYTLISAKINPSSQIYSFEPLAIIYRRLTYNLRINNLTANTYQIALAEEEGEAKIYASETLSDTFDQASLNSDHALSTHHFSIIKKQKMSSFIEEHNVRRIHLMKIDVETYEPNVLRGMGIYLSAFRPTILIEILNAEIGESVFDIVKGLGYQFIRIDEKKGYFMQQNLLPVAQKGNNFLLLNASLHPTLKFANGQLIDP